MRCLTTKEKIQRCWRKRKDNTEYRQTESERIGSIRKRGVNTMTNAEKEEYKRKAREQKQKYRAAKPCYS